MSTIYSGNPANVANSLSATINGATNASPIVLSTTVAHGFQTNDIVNVSGVGGNTAANANGWVVTYVDSTHFSLNGSTGSGAYTAGGTAVDISLTPGATIPSDGDPRNAASVNVGLQLALDRTQFLAKLSSSRPDSMFCRHWEFNPTNYLPTGGAMLAQTTTAAIAYAKLDLPQGSTLTGVTMYVIGAAGHAAFPGGKPPVMPTFQIRKMAAALTSSAIGALQTDPSATAVAFEAVHSFSLTGLTEVIDNSSFVYYVECKAENGAAPAISGDIIALSYAFTPSAGRAC